MNSIYLSLTYCKRKEASTEAAHLHGRKKKLSFYFFGMVEHQKKNQ